MDPAEAARILYGNDDDNDDDDNNNVAPPPPSADVAEAAVRAHLSGSVLFRSRDGTDPCGRRTWRRGVVVVAPPLRDDRRRRCGGCRG